MGRARLRLAGLHIKAVIEDGRRADKSTEPPTYLAGSAACAVGRCIYLASAPAVRRCFDGREQSSPGSSVGSRCGTSWLLVFVCAG